MLSSNTHVGLQWFTDTMRSVNVIVTFAVLQLVSAGSVTISKRGKWLGSPAEVYLNTMCLPVTTEIITNGSSSFNLSDRFLALATSPFPCEQYQYIVGSCQANGTTEIDFLAEQQCLCNGAVWDAINGCNNCHLAHGDPRNSSAQLSSYLSSLSAAECTPSPPYQPFSNLLPPRELPTIPFSDKWPNLSLVNDRFPNDTAWSNYWTPTATRQLGEITGSATARLTSWTNSNLVSFTPTNSPASSTTNSQVSASTSSSSSRSTTTNAPTTSVAGNSGVVKEVQVLRRAFIIILGGAVLL